ncbi:hypothetical protein [Saccharothrix syringae]|uniref:Uncharacterized protein n=1 Tax=Saccharothrix syringae TaxID=103733 RepID=A0A5Q0HAT1_SACSY|nr:hypothetical protein [Saccharothrix syringae]QFZ22910.1 hypothetical protein EKG83_40680 [Saccharothrix syringae]
MHPSADDRNHLPAGDPAEEGCGIRAVVTVEAGGPSSDPRRAWGRSGAGAMLEVPLLLPASAGSWSAGVTVAAGEGARSPCWCGPPGPSAAGGTGGTMPTALDGDLLAAPAHPAHHVGGEPAEVAVTTAKGPAEGTWSCPRR